MNVGSFLMTPRSNLLLLRLTIKNLSFIVALTLSHSLLHLLLAHLSRHKISNDNFFVLKSAIEEAKCGLDRLDQKAEDKYWNKVSFEKDGGETIYSDERWVCNDETVATTGAICEHVESEFTEKTVTETDVKEGRWLQNNSEYDSDEHIASTAAITERLDPYFQDNVPVDQPRWRMPGKIWFDSDDVMKLRSGIKLTKLGLLVVLRVLQVHQDLLVLTKLSLVILLLHVGLTTQPFKMVMSGLTAANC